MPRKPRTIESFIEEANKLHNNKYIYDKVDLNKRKIDIYCKECKEYYSQFYYDHLRGHSCKKCSKKIVKNEFIKEMHTNFPDFNYDYSLLPERFSGEEFLEIFCNACKTSFKKPAKLLIRGSMCPICAKRKAADTKKVTKEEFVQRAKLVHGIKYSYYFNELEGIMKKIPIVCPRHGRFFQEPKGHLEGMGCPECKKTKIRKNTFIPYVQQYFKNKYDYSKVDYVDGKTPVTVICLQHGEFQVEPRHHADGAECPICLGIQNFKKKADRSMGKEGFIKRAREVWGEKYDYSKVNYKNSEKVTIICKKHQREFQQTADSHLLKFEGCEQCKLENQIAKQTKTTEDFIKRARIIFEDKYDYSKVEYKDANTPVVIICKIHGEFQQEPIAHLQEWGCSACGHSTKQSVGERKIEEVLISKKIKYIREKIFDGCKNIQHLRFDFYLPELNKCIEFDGIQHFEPTKFSSFSTSEQVIKEFKIVQHNDRIKNEFCKKEGIPLLRIKYSQIDKVEKMLERFILR